jgi:hypothetical protein
MKINRKNYGAKSYENLTLLIPNLRVTGSNPVGVTNKINDLGNRKDCLGLV